MFFCCRSAVRSVNSEKLFEKIRKGHLEYPRSLSPRSVNLLRGLLTKDPRRRLGSGPNDAEDIKLHHFFADTDWKRLAKGEIAPPWHPPIQGSLDTSQFDEEVSVMKGHESFSEYFVSTHIHILSRPQHTYTYHLGHNSVHFLSHFFDLGYFFLV